MLDTERQYFEQHREELLQQFPGKFLVIKDQQVRGAFDTIADALTLGSRDFGTSSFLVRRTDQQPETISIPALTLGILSANTSHTIRR
jgi:hypothetical protein